MLGAVMSRAELFRVLCVSSWFASAVGSDLVNTAMKLASRRWGSSDAIPTQNLAYMEGYDAETHRLITSDGYVIQMTRIMGNSPHRKMPILLMHGLISSSDQWVMRGRGKDLPYILADLGYDVWLGDWRGNVFSHDHVHLSDASNLYWNFTYYHRALFDLPVFIDHVLEVSNMPQLIYIGYSYGTTAAFVLTSKMPEYNEKIRLAVMLAPVGYEHDTLNFPLRVGMKLIELSYPSTGPGQMFELLPRNALVAQFARTLCVEGNFICLLTLFIVFGQNQKNLDKTVWDNIRKRTPSGTSSMDLIYLSQIFLKGFRAYDFGEENNLIAYGESKPPEVEVEKITAPMALFYSTADHLNSEKGIFRLCRRLKNVVLLKKIQSPDFSHIDFMYGKDVEKLLYRDIAQLIMKYSY